MGDTGILKGGGGGGEEGEEEERRIYITCVLCNPVICAPWLRGNLCAKTFVKKKDQNNQTRNLINK